MRKIGILGSHGIVGGSLRKYFEKKPNYKLFLYDKKNIGSMSEVNKADFIYICLPTPYIPGRGCDISLIKHAIKEVTGCKVLIIKSTVIPGTTEKLQSRFPQHKLLFNPEFITEETSDQDMCFPDRQILGYTRNSFTISKDVIQQLPLAPYERIVPATVAEFIKYATNTWFATKVAMNNELYDLCKKVGLTNGEWDEVVSGMTADKRIGRTHLTIIHKNKRGYWGKCLPKDMKSFIEFANENGVKLPIRQAVDSYNDNLLKKQNIKPYI